MKQVTIYTDGEPCWRTVGKCPHSLSAARKPLGDETMRRRRREEAY